MIVRALGVSLVLAVSQAAQPPLDPCAENSQSGRERHCEMREESPHGTNGARRRSRAKRRRARPRMERTGRAAANASRGLRRRHVARARARGCGPSDDAGGTASDGRPDGARQRALGDVLLSRCAGEHAACDQHEQRRHFSRRVQRAPRFFARPTAASGVRAAAGDIRGRTQNGGLHVELAGPRWEGEGLDVETRNGSVRLTLPANYSAEFETGTVHGRVQIDFPATIHSGRERRFTATLGSGGPKVRAVTTNGSVVVRRQ